MMKTEKELIEEMRSILQEKMKKDYEKGKIKRDAHPKDLGLLKAKFKVADDLPEHLQVGVFQAGKSYNSLIRFSNASGKVQSDKKKDFRGMAIKLIGVEGERFDQTEQSSQDFLLMSYPTMPLGTVKLFRDAVYYSIKYNPLVLILKFIFTGKGYILKELNSGKRFDTSPLDINYWSTTPYLFGDKQVKYKVIPTSATKSELPKNLTDDYLRDNMSSHLSNDVASFDFYIQEFIDEVATPIEDAGVEWHSPFVKLATIEIPRQTFDTAERKELAEQLSFSPANSLMVHQPIGGINRARNEIYKALSDFRHKENKQVKIEASEELFSQIN